jgi:hypothetical protein
MARPHQQLPCLRIEPATGKGIIDYRYPEAECDYWVEFQKRHHPDRALFIGERLVSKGGYLTDAEALLARQRQGQIKARLP